jgi:hypothetical protein
LHFRALRATPVTARRGDCPLTAACDGKPRTPFLDHTMRAIGALSLLLAVTLWSASHLGSPADAGRSSFEPPRWRRTVDGWERLSTVPPARRTSIEALHPGLVALGLLQLALLGLLGLERTPASASEMSPKAAANPVTGTDAEQRGRIPLGHAGI